MRRGRLRSWEWAWVLALFAVWLGLLGLCLRSGLRDGAAVFTFGLSSAPSGDYPVVSGRNLLAFREPELELGDRVVRVGEADLLGATSFEARIRLHEAAGETLSAPAVIERHGERFETTLTRVPTGSSWWTGIPFAVALAVCSLLLLVRAPDWALGRRWYLASLLACMLFTPVWSGDGRAVAIGLTVQLLVFPATTALVIENMFLLFAEETRLRPWQRGFAWAMGLLTAASWLGRFLVPGLALGGLVGATGLASVTSMLGAMVWGRRRADALARRRYRWVFLGFTVGLAPLAGVQLLTVLGLVTPSAWALARFALVAVPLGVLAAVIWYDWLDIDRLISATASYTILAVLLIAGGFSVIPRVAASAGPAVGVDPSTAQLFLSMALAALLVPLHQTLRPRIDRAFFKERYAVEQGFERLLAELSRCRGPEEITRVAGERIDELLRPESIVFYARAEEVFTPIFVRARAVPPAFGADNPLIAALSVRTAPLAAEKWSNRRDEELSPFDRAALETLGAAIVGPVRRGENLVAFSCIGPKRSGDIYTPTDLALLTAVGAKVSEELLRIDDEQVIQEARHMQESLRRYVPGAVADQLSSGRELDSGEREVSVLFVDIRGYVRFSEGREAADIFSTVNRHTEAVSAIVSSHGGSVVEFNGDGMMAVFGAPEPLASKEGSAVEAAREIVVSTEARPGDLSVGVGIATGRAFVGNIQSADRLIWSVIGNTTNLAARLQALTRDLDAAIAVDDPTRAGAGEACADFDRHAEVAIRGRSERLDVWALRARGS